MGLHRDIYWVGRQWAVTGFGVQAIDQRLSGAFDIAAALLWDDDVSGRLRAQSWVNADDFDKALAIARKRFPEDSLPKPPVPPVPPSFALRTEGALARFLPQWRIRSMG